MILSTSIDRMEGHRARRFQWMVLLSLVFHGVVFSLGSSALVRPTPFARDTVVTMELTEPPSPEPPPPAVLKSLPAPPASAAVKETGAADRQPLRPSARRWLEKLDDPLAEKRVAMSRGRDTPARSAHRASLDPPIRPDDIAASRLRPRAGEERFDELEKRVVARRSPTVLGVEGTGAGLIVSGVSDDQGDPIPAAVRDMIRNRVAGYLPELEAAYSSAFRFNPNLKGRLVIRIRIDARGNVARVEPVEAAVPDKVFAAVVLEKVRGWVFRPAAGFAVEVIYPFVFVAPT